MRRLATILAGALLAASLGSARAVEIETALGPVDVAAKPERIAVYDIAHENLTFRIEARNIFNKTYTSRASYGQDFDGTVPHLEPGRTFRFNACMKF